MTTEPQTHVLVVGVGGLGTHMIHEALERGVQVSVMVRDESRLKARLDEEVLRRLTTITVGDATDPAALDRAMQGIDVALSGNGANREMAHQMALAVQRNNVQKLIWPAGGSNVMAEDGITPAYLKHMDRFPRAKDI